jgi:glycopeptide antibiotics resistance protein
MMGSVWGVGGVGRWLPVVVISIAALPLCVPAAMLLARRRLRLGVPASTAWRHSVAEVAIVVGTLPWVWMILTPVGARREIRPVPLADIGGLLAGGDLAFAFVQIGGNLLVFAAFGFFAPLRWRIGVAGVTAVAAIASAVVETLQFVLDLGRVSSVDDVLLNAAGAGLAALVSRVAVRGLRSAQGRSTSVP